MVGNTHSASEMSLGLLNEMIEKMTLTSAPTIELRRNSLMTIQRGKLPRSKKKRVIKKWRKRYGYSIPDPNVYKFNNAGKAFIVGHPATIARMECELRLGL